MIVGRDPAIADINRLLSHARERTSALLIVGEPGIGKTTIFREAMRLGEEAGFAVLSCRPAASESAFALAAVADIVRDVPAAQLAVLPAPQRQALEVALHLSEPGDDPIEQSALAAGVRSLVAAMGAERPVLLGIDDVQWLDDGSAAVLAFVIRRIGPQRVAVLATQRSGEEAAIDLDAILPATTVARTQLRSLSLGAVGRLLAERFDPAPTRSSVVRIHEASQGNPLYAIELARLLADRGPLHAGEPLPVPNDIRAIVGERVGALPKPTRDLLLGAALLAHPRMTVLESIFGARTSASFHVAERAGIAWLDGGAFTFSHPLHAAAVIDGASPDERRHMHQRLADRIDDIEERAQHLALATETPDGETAQLVEAGAESAARRGNLHAAADLSERSRTLTPSDDGATARRRGLRAAELHEHAGDRVRSRALLEELLTEPLEREQRGTALRLLGELHVAEEDVAGAETALIEALSFADAVRSRATIRLVLCYVASLRLDFVQAARWAQEALDDLPDGDDDALMAEALARSAMCDFIAGFGVDWDKLDRALRLDDPGRMTLPGLGAAGVVGCVMMYAGRHAESRAIMASVRQRLFERGDEAELATAMVWSAWLETRAGNFEAAAESADEAIAYARLTSNDAMGRMALAQRAWVDAHTGDLSDARRRAAEALLPPGVGIAQIGIFVASTNALVASTLGDHLEAWEACREGIEVVDRLGVGEPAPLMFLPDAAEALVGLGELDRADRLIEAFARRGRELDRVWAIATAARCRGLLLAARGDLDGALAALEGALTAHDRLDMPFERARTLFVKGSVHRRARQRAHARQALEGARAEFQRLGARLWAERSAEELDRIGRHQPTAGDGLTPAERRAAELARAGHSNKEIAQALFVSVHTVEVHLSRAYQKLGVRSRSQLARKLASESDGN
jgi:DNA-binding CsgD family transcriptional regulator